MPFIVLIITMSTGYGLTTYMIVRGGQTRFHGLAGFGLVHFFCTKLEVEIRFVKGNELLPLTGLKRFPPVSILHTPKGLFGSGVFVGISGDNPLGDWMNPHLSPNPHKYSPLPISNPLLPKQCIW
jgi:hypothetical protein